MILAILLNPIVSFLHRKGINRVVAIILAILSMFIVIGGIFFFIGSQISMFSEALPELKNRFNELLEQGFQWVSHRFNISQSQLDSWLERKKSEQMEQVGGKVGSTLLTVGSALVLVFLVPVYIFLFLFYKPLLLEFIRRLFKADNDGTVHEVLGNTKILIQSYLLGLMIEMVIVATLNSTALLIIGIDYAIVLGVIGALLNLIPYIGGLVAIALPMIMGLLSGEPMSALFVLGAYALIQLADNNFIVPMIVASKVKVNALVSIVVVLIGGALWGVAGMFLAIPLAAIFKVVCDNIKGMEPFGYVIGDDMPPPTKLFQKKKEMEEKHAPDDVKPPQQ